jgi:DNA-binding LacI/PurR family transcriptional regulator
VAELARIGRSVPGDISVMSIMSSLDMAAMCNPPLTTVTAPAPSWVSSESSRCFASSMAARR